MYFRLVCGNVEYSYLIGLKAPVTFPDSEPWDEAPFEVA